MKVGVIGGLMVGGLTAMGIVGIIPGLILIAFGAGWATCDLYKEHRQRSSARAQYPSYKY